MSNVNCKIKHINQVHRSIRRPIHRSNISNISNILTVYGSKIIIVIVIVSLRVNRSNNSILKSRVSQHFLIQKWLSIRETYVRSLGSGGLFEKMSNCQA